MATMTEGTEISLSKDQQQVHDAVIAWYKAWRAGGADAKQVLTIGGYAGTGKTTLTAATARTLRKEIERLRIAFCCFTGKAALVLRGKLQAAGAVDPYADHAGTIHSLIYKPVYKDGVLTGWKKVDELDYDLIVLDEASMVAEEIFKDLLGYGLPILAVGDHGQLPPVKGELNLMQNPELRLEQIHRQAADNPIIRLSMMARLEGRIPVGRFGDYVHKVTDRRVFDKVGELRDLMVICGTNRTRVSLNYQLRKRLGYLSEDPETGEKVICLKNNRDLEIFNGMTGVIQAIAPAQRHTYPAKIKMDGLEAPIEQIISRYQFGAAKTLKDFKPEGEMLPLHHRELGLLFDWGYAVTCHKAQGSEARRVVVFEECDWMENEDHRRRWLYTAVTRSSERLLIVGK
jgi:exodeoxyribonuclease-5